MRVDASQVKKKEEIKQNEIEWECVCVCMASSIYKWNENLMDVHKIKMNGDYHVEM